MYLVTYKQYLAKFNWDVEKLNSSSRETAIEHKTLLTTSRFLTGLLSYESLYICCYNHCVEVEDVSMDAGLNRYNVVYLSLLFTYC